MEREIVSEREGLMAALSRKIWESMIQDLQQGKTTSFYFGLDRADSLLRDGENESPGDPDDNGQ